MHTLYFTIDVIVIMWPNSAIHSFYLHLFSSNRPALIFVHGDLKWDKFHLMISRSTTPDLIKIVNKMEEFFTQQFASSKRVLSAFGPIPGTNKLKAKRKNSEEGTLYNRTLHEVDLCIAHCILLYTVKRRKFVAA